MSLDRMQSKQGFLILNPEPSFTVASSLSSVASNQLPGGLIFGSQFGLCQATAGSNGGGAPIVKVQVVSSPGGVSTSFSTSSGTGAAISHDQQAVIVVSCSAGGLHSLQPAVYHGQQLTIVNIAGSASLVTGFTTSGQGTGSTTTAAIPTLFPATTISASGFRQFVALSNLGSTNSNSTYAVWQCVA
jgi:hypothetical protein